MEGGIVSLISLDNWSTFYSLWIELKMDQIEWPINKIKLPEIPLLRTNWWRIFSKLLNSRTVISVISAWIFHHHYLSHFGVKMTRYLKWFVVFTYGELMRGLMDKTFCSTHPSNVSHISRLVSKHSTPSPKIGWYFFKSYLVHWKQSTPSSASSFLLLEEENTLTQFLEQRKVRCIHILTA